MDDEVEVQPRPGAGETQYIDALVIGAGFGGMYMLHRLRERQLTVRGIEAGGDVGGTWYWNRYPGARCDVMSIDYSYSFSDEIQQEWTWSERFAEGQEIRAYQRFVADKLDLRRDIQFNTRAQSVAYDDAKQRWIVETDRGDRFEAIYCIMATGPLSVPKDVDIPGVETFDGQIYLSGKWPHEAVDFKGLRVGVVGTGSSGIQIVPVVAEDAQELFVFQRTPSFSMPMRNGPIDADYMAQVKANYPALRAAAKSSYSGGVRSISSRPFFSVPVAEREELLQDAWRRGALALMGTFSDLLSNAAANEIVAEFVRGKIDEVVEDPETAERLKPRGYPIFARRPVLDTNYYEAFNRPNVKLVDCLTDPIAEITPTGIRTNARRIDLDIIILATGYDGLTGAMLAVEMTGRGGRRLKDKWAAGSKSYLGLAMEGFPNLFIIAGANGPSAFANFVILNEQNAEWILDCIDYMRAHDLTTIEATTAAETEWMAAVSSLAQTSLIPRANTWYTGANIPGKPRVFGIYTGGFNRYREICAQVASEGYRGFTFEPGQKAAKTG
ncbi:NAD(P)/FAD-dependent oxidoreductase [Phenylobacterium sp.]|uniref:flavin-containing monooxygenase n=1 Tax=Phenylobacterium sp. TaxID=1871053 RepID=UPI0025DBC644|nr:NAD(P)/FAD-dependent oxidoreductase [Phenylobacterium sp.]